MEKLNFRLRFKLGICFRTPSVSDKDQNKEILENLYVCLLQNKGVLSKMRKHYLPTSLGLEISFHTLKCGANNSNIVLGALYFRVSANFIFICNWKSL